MTEATVAAAFAQLQSVDAAYLTKGAGEWKGHAFNTGHPTYQKMKDLHWAGKTFRDSDDVDPIVVYDTEGKRVWNADWGHARASPMYFVRVAGEVANELLPGSCAKCRMKARIPSRWCMTTSRLSITSALLHRIWLQVLWTRKR